MSENDLEEQLRRIIAQTVRSKPTTSAIDLAHWIRQHHAALTEPFYDRWIDAGLASLCRVEIRLQRPMKRGRPGLGHPQQVRFPFVGFEDIPYRMTIEPSTKAHHGKEIFTERATLEQLKQRRMLVQGQFSAELPQLKKLIALMERYDKAQPGITVGEALKLQAARKNRSKLG